jgi:NADH pyrophosphatase NudC (nudix superfamily)
VTLADQPTTVNPSASALTEEIKVDPEELVEARWFARDEIRDMVARAAAADPDPATTVPSLPGPVAIAHQICRRWANRVDSI